MQQKISNLKEFLKVWFCPVVLTIGVVLLFVGNLYASHAMAEEKPQTRAIYVEVTGYVNSVDYQELMNKCLNDGSSYALEVGAIYEKQRNLKITEQKLPYPTTTYFQDYKTAEEIKKAMAPKPEYEADEVALLEQVVMAECGSNWIPDWVQQATAGVVLNRVKSSAYPNKIAQVIYQQGQYGCVSNGSFYNTPSQKVKDNVAAVLNGDVAIPSGVVGQSGAVQGKVWKSYYDSVLGTTMYFCYM